MADEFLNQQDEVTEATADMIIGVADAVTGVMSYITVQNFRAMDVFYLKKPGGGWLAITADDDNQLIYTPIVSLP